MEGATHFIEQYYNTKNNLNIVSKALPIKDLNIALQATMYYPNLYTVCIFKIKLKNKQHEN